MHFKSISKRAASGARASGVILLAVTFGLLLPVSQAQAASVFEFEGRLKVGVDSREFHTSKDGTLKLRASAYSCEYRSSSPASMKVKIELQHMSWVWNNKGSVTVKCNGTEYKSFKNMPKGSYRLHITKVNDGAYLTAGGDVTYP